MSYTVKWLPEAELTFAMVMEYLEQNWSSKEVETFINRTDEVIDFIAQRPHQYIYSKKKDAYRAVVTKQISLYYRLKSKEVELLVFWDTRQDPSKLKF